MYAVLANVYLLLLFQVFLSKILKRLLQKTTNRISLKNFEARMPLWSTSCLFLKTGLFIDILLWKTYENLNRT